jgi:hypothetical protein
MLGRYLVARLRTLTSDSLKPADGLQGLMVDADTLSASGGTLRSHSPDYSQLPIILPTNQTTKRWPEDHQTFGQGGAGETQTDGEAWESVGK